MTVLSCTTFGIQEEDSDVSNKATKKYISVSTKA